MLDPLEPVLRRLLEGLAGDQGTAGDGEPARGLRLRRLDRFGPQTAGDDAPVTGPGGAADRLSAGQVLQKGGIDKPLERWQSIVDLFDASAVQLSMTEFLLTVWRSRYETLSAKNLMKAVRKKIKKAQAAGFLGQLISDSELFGEIHELDYRKWAKEERAATESLRFFRDFGIRQPMTLVLSLMRELTPGESVEAVTTGVARDRGLPLQLQRAGQQELVWRHVPFYGKRARDLLQAGGEQERAKFITELISELRSKRATDAEFDEAFADLWLDDEYTSVRKVVR